MDREIYEIVTKEKNGRKHEAVRAEECTKHVRMEGWIRAGMEECGRSMAHNVTPDKAETEINKLSVSLQENLKVP